MATATRPERSRTNIGKIIKEISQLLVKEATNSIPIRSHIGAKLIELKQAIEHGRWTKTLKKLGINERTAERLMQFATSPIGQEIRTHRTDLAQSLPSDLQKLVLLCPVPKARLDEVISAIDLRRSSCRRISNKIALLLGTTRGIGVDNSVDDDDDEPARRKSVPPHARRHTNDSCPDANTGHGSGRIDGRADNDDNHLGNVDLQAVSAEDSRGADEEHSAENDFALSRVVELCDLVTLLADAAIEEIDGGSFSASELQEILPILAKARKSVHRLINAASAYST